MYYFYLNNLQIPIPPKSLDITVSNKNETIDLLQTGEVTIPKPLGLTEYSFEILLPNSKYPFNQSILEKSKKAEYYAKKIVNMKSAGNPVKFTVVRMKPNGEMLSMVTERVTIEDLETKEDHDYGFDMYISIKLRQWRDYGTKKLVIEENKDGTANASVKTERPTDKVPAKEVKSPNGFNKATLQRVVKQQFGNTNNLFKIAALNKIGVPCYLGATQALSMYNEGKGTDAWTNLILKK
nr:MAG TPA: tail assembly protein [Caudoviricetes sp.]